MFLEDSSFLTQFGSIALILVMVLVLFFMFRSQKKQEKKATELRNSLQVGDEVTTIGGIVGKIVSLREETVVLETTKDKTHIRFLRAAIRNVDVRAEDSVNPVRPETKPADKKKTGNKPAAKKPVGEPEAVGEPETVAAPQETAAEEIVTDKPADDTVPPEGKAE